jgi:hypothetical protein
MNKKQKGKERWITKNKNKWDEGKLTFQEIETLSCKRRSEYILKELAKKNITFSGCSTCDIGIILNRRMDYCTFH